MKPKKPFSVSSADVAPAYPQKQSNEAHNANIPPSCLMHILSKLQLENRKVTHGTDSAHLSRLTDSLFLANTDAEEILSSLYDEEADRACKKAALESVLSGKRPQQYPPPISVSLAKGSKARVAPLEYSLVEGLDGQRIPIEETLARRYFGKDARVTFFAKFQKMKDSRLLVSAAARPRRFVTRGDEMRYLGGCDEEEEFTQSVNAYGVELMGSLASNTVSGVLDGVGGGGTTVCSTVDHRFDDSDTLPSAGLLSSAMSRPVGEFFDDLRTLATRDPAYRKLDADIMAFNSFNVYQLLMPTQSSGDTARSSGVGSSATPSTWTDPAGTADGATMSTHSGGRSGSFDAALPSLSQRRRETAHNRSKLQRNNGKLPALQIPSSPSVAATKLSNLDIQLESMRAKSRQGNNTSSSPVASAAILPPFAAVRHNATHIVAGGDFDNDNSLPSPRTKYLSGCIRENVHPLVNLIIRKTMVSSLNWAHYGMGDVMGRVLADCIQDLPCVESINLNDNNLTDDSLQFLIQALTEIKTLRHLNLSRNKVDGESSDALADYLAREDCPLTQLTMQSADVDDGEADRFIQCLTSNKQLLELDLSANMLGAAESQSVADADVVTGGASIAAFISSASCRLTSLKLAWNSIRGASAVKLAAALSLNNTITYLDLSSNGLGWAAGEQLGDSIMENRTLKHLLVSNNNFTSSAIMSICIGAMENLALNSIVLDENPIGQAGAKIMMQVSMALGSRISVSAANCNTTSFDARCWYDPAKPIRDYKLTLSDPYDRAVAFHLLYSVASHATLVFATSTYETPSGQMKPLKLVQAVATDRELYFDEEQRSVVAGLRRLSAAASNTKLGEELFYEADADGSGKLDKGELKDVLDKIGFIVDDERLQDILAVFDVDGSGEIEMPDFLGLLKAQVAEANARIKELVEYPIMALAGATKTKYVPPRKGTLHLKVIDGFIRKKNFYTLSVIDQKYAYKMAKGMGDVMMMADAVQNARTRYNEAYSMYKTMYKECGDKTAVLVKVIPEMMHPWEAKQLVSKATNDDRMEVARLKLAFGVAIRPIFGNYNGYYCLDLSKDLHRICLSRLLEQSNTMNSRRAAQSIIAAGRVGDISQHGNWSSFRNEMLDGESITITPDKFTPMPTRGIVEFDFSGGTRPTASDLRISDKRMIKVLNNIVVLNPAGNADAKERLAAWKRNAHVTNRAGTLFMPMYAFDQKKALDAGLAADDFYGNLEDRQELVVIGAKREEIKVNFMDESVGGEDGSQSQSATVDSIADASSSLRVDGATDEEGGGGDGGGSSDMNDGDGGDGDGGAEEGNSPDDHSMEDRSVESSLEDSLNSESVEMSEDYQLYLRKKRIKEMKTRLATLLKAKKGVSKYAKVARFVDVIEETCSSLWIMSRHLALIITCLKDHFGDVSRSAFFGSYYVELVVALFARVVDLHNFEIVLEVLDARECACVFARIGILNIFNPLKPEVTYELNLARYEDRVVAKMIVFLSVDEPGINLTFKKFQWKREIDPIPGWDVTEPWATEDGLPKNGMFTSTYYSGEGRNKFGCVPNIPLRKAFCQLVLIDENEIITEDEICSDPQNHAIEHFEANRQQWSEYLVPGCDDPNKKTVFGQNYRYL